MKNKGREIEVFGEILNTLMKGNAKVSTYPAIVTEVDWEAKTATVKGVIDDLEFYDVLLGLGSIYVKPEKGSLCLIGVILGNEAQTFLISAASVEGFDLVDKIGFKCSLNNGLMTINGESYGGIVKATELKTQIDKNTAILQAIQTAFQSWAPVPTDGGASLKALSSQFIALQRANLNNIQNTKIKHGNGS